MPNRSRAGLHALLSACVLALAAAGCGQGVIAEDPDAGPLADGGAVCGDGVKVNGEECDLGTANGTNAGCERDCRFSCVAGDPVRGDAACDPHDPCKGHGQCGGDHLCRVTGALPEGSACGTGHICRNGACQAPVCGDGQITAPEECDDGKNDGTQGCGQGCLFVCKSTDSARSCTPADPCQGPAVCNDTTHLCGPRTPLGDGVSCGTGKVCISGGCRLANCGDHIIEAPEECDPPDGVTCDASCKKIVHAVCGNGVREGTEQCDDGNLVNLDGCDSTCKFEQDLRANAVTMLFKGDSFCAANAIGGSIGSAAQSQVQSAVASSVADGSLTMGFQFLGLTDLSGTSAPSFKLGAVSANPYAAPPGKKYDGTKDLDWWYQTQPADLDAARKPTAQLSASITAKALSAGPGNAKIALVFGAGPVELAASQVRVKGDIGASSAPTATPAATPGHTPSEHLDAALVSFATLANGELCANLSADSLANVPAPASVQSGGSISCAQGYGTANSLLDVIVGGCTVYVVVTAISATQPDTVDPSLPRLGAGGPYKLSTSSRKVTGCKDKNGGTVALADCLKAAAYSSAFTFAADRVVLK